ncbi:MAG: cupin domain-containing protein [Azospirillaceae bacterium]
MTHRRTALGAGVVAALLVAAPVAAQDAVVSDLAKSALPDAPGGEALAKHYDVPPGWTTPAHAHSGHVMLYVVRGTAELALDGETVTATAGSLLEADAGEAMVMQNPSDDERLEFVVFQVGPEGAPYIALVE